MGWRYANDEERRAASLARRRARYHDPEFRLNRIAVVKKSRDKRVAANPDIYKTEYRDRVQKNPRHNKYANLLKYGMSLEKYDALLVRQGGVCAICDQPETAILNGEVKSLAVDHDKRFPKSHRLLLCSNCNRALGLFRENTTILENAIAYVEYWRTVNG